MKKCVNCGQEKNVSMILEMCEQCLNSPAETLIKEGHAELTT